MIATSPFLYPKTVAEQAAFEFAKQVTQLRHISDKRTVALIGRRYAHTHQYAAFPRSDDGYGRLLAAFCAGAGLDLNEV